MRHTKLHIVRLCALALSVLILADSISPAVHAVSDSAETHPLYAAPTTRFEPISVFSDGDTVVLIETLDDNWSAVRLEDGSVGYCSTDLLGIPSSDTDSAASFTRTTAATKVYSTPDKSATALSILPKHARITAMETDDPELMMVQLANGKLGYVSSDNVETVTESKVPVRTVPKLTADTGITTEDEAAERLVQLSAYFQNGRYWNCIGTGTAQSSANMFTVTDSPCAHLTSGYGYCNIYTGCMVEPLDYYVGMQCLGYVNLLSDLVFGTDAPLSVHGDFEKIRVGDHVRLVLWDHSMLVTEVGKDEKGKTCIYATEVNADYDTCRIDWGRRFTQDDLRRLGDYVEVYTRYPSEDIAETEEIQTE